MVSRGTVIKGHGNQGVLAARRIPGTLARVLSHASDVMPVNKMWVKLLYDRIWIRDVCWLGPLGPEVLGSDSKNTSRILIFAILKKRSDHNV